MSQSNKIKKDVYDINLKLSNSDLVIQNFGNGSQRGKIISQLNLVELT